MKKFRKPKVENEQQRQAEQSYGEVESIPVFKERGRKRERETDIQAKSKVRNTLKHG